MFYVMALVLALAMPMTSYIDIMNVSLLDAAYS